MESVGGDFVVTETPQENPALCAGSASVGSFSMELPITQNPVTHECLAVAPEIRSVRMISDGVELQCFSSLFFEAGQPATDFVAAEWTEYERCYPIGFEADPLIPPALRCEYHGTIVRTTSAE